MDLPISVIVPVYNVAPFLRKCIDCIIVQSFKDFELLLIDDGSHDESVTICDEYALKDSRIHVVHQINAGVTAARRKGVEMARGNWLCFVDGDDMLPEDALLDLYNNGAEGVDIVIGNQIHMVDEQGNNVRKICTQSSSDDWSNIDFLKALLEGKTPLSVCGKLYRRDLFDSLVFDLPKSMPYGEDYIMNVRLAVKVQKVRAIDRHVYNYVQHKNSCMHTFQNTWEYAKKMNDFLLQPIKAHGLEEVCKKSIFYAHIHMLLEVLIDNDPGLFKKDPFFVEIKEYAKTIKLSLREWMVLKMVACPFRLRCFVIEVARKLSRLFRKLLWWV
jgi:glycosyltransferase involved in cell wall biosynthesis